MEKELRLIKNNNQLWTKHNLMKIKNTKHFYLPILSKIGDRDNQISYMPLGQCRKRSSNQKCFVPNKNISIFRTMQKYVVIKN